VAENTNNEWVSNWFSVFSSSDDDYEDESDEEKVPEEICLKPCSNGGCCTNQWCAQQSLVDTLYNIGSGVEEARVGIDIANTCADIDDTEVFDIEETGEWGSTAINLSSLFG